MTTMTIEAASGKSPRERPSRHGIIKLMRGDIIKLIAPKTVHGYHLKTFFIDYIDDSKMKLINLSSMTVSTLNINKDRTIEDDTIDLISLLFRNKTPSYARQHKLLPGTWININFLLENDVPKIETGEITNLEEDMIEIKLFPSNTIIYLNFEYKGMIDNITRWLVDELKHDAEIVNGLEELTDGTEDIVHGRYEVSRELLHYIRSLQGESQHNIDEGDLK